MRWQAVGVGPHGKLKRDALMSQLTPFLTPTIAALATTASLATAWRPPADVPNQLTDQEKKAGWTLLFDGKSLNGWRGYKKTDTSGTRWQVEDGYLTVN